MKQAGDSMADGLKKILSSLAVLGTMPDSDLEFLTKLQLVIQQKVQQMGMPSSMGGPQPQGMPGGMGGAPGGLGQPPPPGAPPGAMMGSPMQGLGMTPANMGAPPQGMPNMDELSRVLGAQGNG